MTYAGLGQECDRLCFDRILVIGGMMVDSWVISAIGGVFSGLLAGLLGIGGGTFLVPFLVALRYTPVEAVATSGLAILITSSAGTVQNWRMGYIDPKRVLYLGLPALLTAQIGVFLADRSKGTPYLLLSAFGVLLLINIYLVDLRKRLTPSASGEGTIPPPHPTRYNPATARFLTGGLAGFLAGLFGVGGGVIMVPMQMLLLGEAIKVAIQTSLGVVVITAISASVGHALSQNIQYLEAIVLGLGGLVGVQFSTRLLPKLSDKWVSRLFRIFLGGLALYVFWQAWISYANR
ncbi:MAG: sulfite exporter TauE/SafE family protein [Leptolyngbyaceae cyanobacterium bins.59]|nr:sulfite exporter TauE/SafE family protein [Leptolyngbyaceae cyanobacterium bins.59]